MYALAAARFVHFAATMTLFGGCCYAAVLAPASLRPDLQPLLRRGAPALALAALASAVLWLLLVAREMAGALDGETLRDVLFGTAFGAVWRARLVLLAALTLVCLAPRRIGLAAVLAGLAVASLGLVGHAAREDGALGLAHRANHALHLLTAGAWLGGLAPFLVSLTVFRDAPQRRDALAAMMRFSSTGHLNVAVVLLTGGLEVFLTTGALPWPAATPYRLGLDLKIGAVGAMTALALVNRYVFAPRSGDSARAARALAAGAVAEIGLALAAVALVSRFALLDPN